jgi:hypothetical protein
MNLSCRWRKDYPDEYHVRMGWSPPENLPTRCPICGSEVTIYESVKKTSQENLHPKQEGILRAHAKGDRATNSEKNAERRQPNSKGLRKLSNKLFRYVLALGSLKCWITPFSEELGSFGYWFKGIQL